MKCAACGVETPRLTRDQRYCPQCDRRIAAVIAADSVRRAPRFTARDLTGRVVL